MKGIKKITGALLALAMLISAWGIFPTPGMAEDAAADVYQIAKFDNIEAINAMLKDDTLGQLSAGTGTTYNGADYSLLWTLPQGAKGTPSIKTGIDWSEYAGGCFKVRYYAENAGDKFTVIANYHGKSTLKNNPYFYYEITAGAAGWQEASIPVAVKSDSADGFRRGSARPAVEGGENVTVEFNMIKGIYFTLNWNNTVSHTTGDKIYIDEISLEKADRAYSVNHDEIKDGDLIVYEVTSGGDIGKRYKANNVAISGNAKYYSQSIDTVNAREGGNEAYVTLTNNSKDLANNQDFYLGKKTDLSEYKDGYLNIWMYSPKATNNGLCITVNSGGGIRAFYLGSDENAFKDKDGVSSAAMDWEGWKLISIPVNNPLLPDIYNGGLTDITQVRLRIKYATEYFCQSRWYQTGSYGVEKIWFSKEKPEYTAPALPQNAQKAVLPEGNLLLAEFNDTQSADSTMNAYGAIGGRYDMTAKSNLWDNSDKAKNIYLYKADTAGVPLAGTGYKYVNSWIYNPGPRSSTVKLRYGVYSADEMTGATEDITMDWTGWRLVSLALPEDMEDIGDVRLSVSPSVSGYTDTAMLNYICADRVWLSEKLPEKAELESITAEGGVYTFNFSGALDARDADKIAVYKDNVKLDGGYSAAITGSKAVVTLPADEGGYRIKIDKTFRDADGYAVFDNNLVYAAVSSDKLTLKNGKINGYDGMTLSNIRRALNIPESAYLIFTDADGAEITDETKAGKEGMSARITVGGFTETYALGVPYYEYTVTSTRADGKITATFKGENYKKSAAVNLTFVAAEYDENKNLVGAGTRNITLGADGEVEVSVSLDGIGADAAAFLWNADLTPIRDKITLD